MKKNIKIKQKKEVIQLYNKIMIQEKKKKKIIYQMIIIISLEIMKEKTVIQDIKINKKIYI